MVDEDLLEPDYPWLDKEDTVSNALKLFQDWDMILLKDGKKLAGVVKKNDMLRTKISNNARLKRFMVHPPIVAPDWKEGDIARVMLESGMLLLPVVNRGDLIGAVTGEKVLDRMVRGNLGDGRIGDIMATSLTTLGPEDTVSRAESIMKERSISRLPVIDNGKLVGIITMDDIVWNMYHPEHRPRGSNSMGDTTKSGELVGEKKDFMKIPVRGIMSDGVSTMPPDSKVREVYSRIKEMGYRGMIIQDEDGKLGLVTRMDLIRPLVVDSRPGNFMIQFFGEFREIPDFYREEARKEILDHLGMHEEYLGPTEVVVELKLHKENMKGKSNTFCEIRLTSPKRGRFVATDDGWGYRHAIRKASKAVEKQIRRGRRD